MSEEEQHWHFISVVDQEQYGPYTAEQLQEFVAKGSITKETLVWTEALEDQWIPATNVEGLFPADPPKPQLLTGAAAQSAHPLGAAHTPTQVQQHPVAQAAALPQQQVAPGMIPSSMPGTVPQAAPLQAAPAGGGMLPQPAPGGTISPGMLGRVAPGEMYPAPGFMKASYGLLISMIGLYILIAIATVIAFMGRISAAVRTSGSATAEDLMSVIMDSLLIIGGGMALAFFCWLIYRILATIYLYRAWRAIQWGGVRCSAGKAVGFLFIPFFNFYWFFVAYVGLAKDWNRVVASHPNLAYAPRLSPGLMMANAIFWVIWMIWFLRVLTMSGNPEPETTPLDTILGLCNLAGLVIELIVYAGICRCVNFMGRLHLGPMPGHPGQPMGGPTPGSGGGGIRLY